MKRVTEPQMVTLQGWAAGGVFRELSQAIQAALDEIRGHRDSEKSSTYTFNPKGRRATIRELEERGGGRRSETRGKKAK